MHELAQKSPDAAVEGLREELSAIEDERRPAEAAANTDRANIHAELYSQLADLRASTAIGLVPAAAPGSGAGRNGGAAPQQRRIGHILAASVAHLWTGEPDANADPGRPMFWSDKPARCSGDNSTY